MNKRTIGNKIFDVVNVLIMIVLACIMPVSYTHLIASYFQALRMKKRNLP